MLIDSELQQKYTALFPYLDERQRRLLAAADSRGLGYGSIARVARAAGLSRPPLHHALKELAAEPVAVPRVRRAGGGRTRLCDTDPAIRAALEALMDPLTRGDPLSPWRWTCKSPRQRATELSHRGHPLSHQGGAEVLRALGYSRPANLKTREGTQHPDREAQLQYLNRTTKAFLAQDRAVSAVDTKQKELVGNYRNGGRQWQPQGQPQKVWVPDFLAPRSGKALPSGVYDVGENLGWVNVGCAQDTARFAVESLRRGWRKRGARLYPRADQVLICADRGGSNGYRVRLWQGELPQFAPETGLAVTVCPFLPGTSKWNTIAHRLVSQSTRNWRGRPLISHDGSVNLSSATTTDTGLRVRAALDKKTSPKGQKVSDAIMKLIPLHPHPFPGEWNYTLKPDV